MSQITENNIEKYKNGEYNHVTIIRWSYHEFGNLSINITELDCSNNQLTSIESLRILINLKKLNCSGNRLTLLEPLNNLAKLESINCSFNQLTSLILIDDDLSNSFNRNNIRRVCPSISLGNQSTNYLRKLKKLDCSSNQLTRARSLEELRRLNQTNRLSNNLMFNRNRSSIGVILSDSSDDESPQFVRSQNTISAFHNNGPIYRNQSSIQNIILRNPPQWYDFDEDEGQNHTYPQMNNFSRINSIYDNNENVMNEDIQKCVRDSLDNLLKDKLIIEDDVLSLLISTSSLSNKVKKLLKRYCSDEDTYSYNIPYKRLLLYVWNRIIQDPNTEELFKSLTQAILDSRGKCPIGRYSQTLNSLSGYYDDIIVNISDNQRISAIITNLMKKYKGKELKEVCRTELLNDGFSEDKIKVWIDPID